MHAVRPRPAPAIREFEVAVPAHLPTLGATVRATLSGGEGAAVVVLGGISATRWAWGGPEGGWWPGMVGPGAAIDPDAHAVLAVDFAADATGRTAPTTADSRAQL